MSDQVLSSSALALSVKLGRYRHFKGGHYEVIGVARNSEVHDEEYVVYKSLDRGGLWIRPLKMFLEQVDRDGYKGPRFQYLGETIKTDL